MLPEVVADPSNDLHFIDIYEEENLKDLNNIYIGYMTKQFAGKLISLGQKGIISLTQKFLSESRKFFQQCVTYLRKLMSVSITM